MCGRGAKLSICSRRLALHDTRRILKLESTARTATNTSMELSSRVGSSWRTTDPASAGEALGITSWVSVSGVLSTACNRDPTQASEICYYPDVWSIVTASVGSHFVRSPTLFSRSCRPRQTHRSAGKAANYRVIDSVKSMCSPRRRAQADDHRRADGWRPQV